MLLFDIIFILTYNYYLNLTILLYLILYIKLYIKLYIVNYTPTLKGVSQEAVCAMDAINAKGIHGMARTSQLAKQGEGLEMLSISKRTDQVPIQSIGLSLRRSRTGY